MNTFRAICVGVLLLGATAQAEVFKGTVAKVHDGDTLTLSDRTRIRLFGIDAPELQQRCRQEKCCTPCGIAARDTLTALAKGELQCEVRGQSYNGVVARCSVGGADIALAMLQSGEVVAYGRYLKKHDPLRARYLNAEATAKRGHQGIWDGQFVALEDWRRQKQRLACERKLSDE